MNPILSIVLPCYNEADNLPLILPRLLEVIGQRKDIEVIVVNNGSKDRTAEVLARELENPALSFIQVVNVPENKGYGYGIMSGLRAAKGDFLAWTHADMQTDPGDVLRGLEKILAAPDPQNVYLKGRRPIFRNPVGIFLTFGMSVMSRACLGVWLPDINAQPKMFSRRFFEMLKSPPDDFAFEVYVFFFARKAGLDVLTVPVSFANRKHGIAKGGGTLSGKWRLVRRTWTYMFRLKREMSRGLR